MSISVTWYDNAAFRVASDRRILWFDPSINKNPDSPIRTSDLKEKADFVFTTHGDPGHFVNSVEVAVKTGALFVAPEELCRYVLDRKELEKERVIPLRIGENQIADDLKVFVFEAEHPEQSKATLEEMAKWGRLITENAGFVVQLGNMNLCHLGDAVYTDVFQKIGSRFAVDVALIPIQGKKKDSPLEEAVESGAKILKDLKPATFLPVIQYTKHSHRVDLLKKRMAELGIQTRVIFEKPGKEHVLESLAR